MPYCISIVPRAETGIHGNNKGHSGTEWKKNIGPSLTKTYLVSIKEGEITVQQEGG
jgi:hypothetical protein